MAIYISHDTLPLRKVLNACTLASEVERGFGEHLLGHTPIDPIIALGSACLLDIFLEAELC